MIQVNCAKHAYYLKQSHAQQLGRFAVSSCHQPASTENFVADEYQISLNKVDTLTYTDVLVCRWGMGKDQKAIQPALIG